MFTNIIVVLLVIILWFCISTNIDLKRIIKMFDDKEKGEFEINKQSARKKYIQKMREDLSQ